MQRNKPDIELMNTLGEALRRDCDPKDNPMLMRIADAYQREQLIYYRCYGRFYSDRRV